MQASVVAHALLNQHTLLLPCAASVCWVCTQLKQSSWWLYVENMLQIAFTVNVHNRVLHCRAYEAQAIDL